MLLVYILLVVSLFIIYLGFSSFSFLFLFLFIFSLFLHFSSFFHNKHTHTHTHTHTQHTHTHKHTPCLSKTHFASNKFLHTHPIFLEQRILHPHTHTHTHTHIMRASASSKFTIHSPAQQGQGRWSRNRRWLGCGVARRRVWGWRPGEGR